MPEPCWLLSVAMRTLLMVLHCFAPPVAAADIEWANPKAMFALSVESVFPATGQAFRVWQACWREPETFLG
ncbi:MAG: hypothetical protein KA945_07735 [Zoogloea sp.]|nr:hypothetical protein [Zoogloea sp.]